MVALPEGAAPLVVGTALALGALALVLSPLLRAVDESSPSPRSGDPAVENPDDRPVTAMDALREIEFDRVTGKLSEPDYAELRQRYTREALAELRAADAGAGVGTTNRSTSAGSVGAPEDAVEAAIARARARQQACGVCGPRPEPDAIYCSSCGRYLPGRCAGCGTSVELVGSRFCSGCGSQLAAA